MVDAANSNEKPQPAHASKDAGKEGSDFGSMLIAGALALAGAFLMKKIGLTSLTEDPPPQRGSTSSSPLSLPPRPPPPNWGKP